MNPKQGTGYYIMFGYTNIQNYLMEYLPPVNLNNI